ncbi:odorant receptor 85b-like [Pieris rapae]|uniref:odorant receptor 85b-like n=1 Tax=Pieris rapae TaxID=64459 RepID=UPI001E27A394|nr:odorant receptor 85b-like [Pieris rapae]
MTIYTSLTTSKIDYQFPLDTYFFSFLQSHWAYAAAYFYISIVGATVHICAYIAIDFILTSITFDVSGLLAALQVDLNDMKVDNEEQDKDYSLVKEIVKDHQKLLRVVDNVNLIFGPLLFVQVTFSSIIICCFGFLTIVGKDLIKSLLATFGVILAMFNFCWSGQLLSDASSGIAEAAYNCPWYNRSVKFRKYIQIIIIRAQKPCTLSALGFSDVTLTTLSKILSTSWSYLSLLNQMYEDIA